MSDAKRNKEVFDQYLGTFQQALRDGDFSGMEKFLSPDLQVEMGSFVFRNREQFIGFYKNQFPFLEETFTPTQVIADDEAIAVEMEVRFLAKKDWPEFVTGAIKKGEQRGHIAFVHYRLRDGKFANILAVLFKHLP
jgi:hypothetical protein